jgi:hypothetical protein
MVRFRGVVHLAALPVVFWFQVGTVPERAEYGMVGVVPSAPFAEFVTYPATDRPVIVSVAEIAPVAVIVPTAAKFPSASIWASPTPAF